MKGTRHFQFHHLCRIQQTVLVLQHSIHSCGRRTCAPQSRRSSPHVSFPFCVPLFLRLTFVVCGWVSLCTTYGPVVRSLKVSSLTLPVSRPLRISSYLGLTAIVLGSATSLNSARFPTMRSRLVRTWIWRGQLQLHGLPDLRKRPW